MVTEVERRRSDRIQAEAEAQALADEIPYQESYPYPIETDEPELDGFDEAGQSYDEDYPGDG